jgi:transposase
VHVPYSSLHRFAIKHCGFAERRRITVRMAECEPGELAEVDFGRLGYVWDPRAGRKRLLWALVVVLVSSRHQYVHTTLAEDPRPDRRARGCLGVLRRHHPAGHPRQSSRAAVTKADRYDPIFQRTFDEYAAYRGFTIDSAIVRHPTGKPHAERDVPYVREAFFRGEEWRDRDDVQARVITWCRETAGKRTHGTTRKRPWFRSSRPPSARRSPPSEGAVRSAALGRGQGPPRPPHQLRQGALLRPDPLHRQDGLDPGRQQARARLLRRDL